MKDGWAPMKLYLTKAVFEASMKRWGDRDKLEDEKERRTSQKIMREKERIQNVAQSISSDVNTVAAAFTADPASGSVLGGFELGGDERSGAIFNKMIEGIDETMMQSTKNLPPSPPGARDSHVSDVSIDPPRKKKAKIVFQTYNQAVIDQQDKEGMRLLAKAESRGSGGKNCKKETALLAARGFAVKKKKGNANPLAAMIKSIRGDN